MGKLAQLYPQVQLHRLLAAALQNDMEITAGQRNNFFNLWTRIGVEFTQNVRRTLKKPGEDTLDILVSILWYPTSHLPLFFLISHCSSVIYFLSLYHTRRLGLPNLLFLCVLLPASIPFPDG
jgi:hypothetical protein